MPRRRTESIHGTFAAACRATWAGAPVVVVVSVVWTLAAAPIAAAVVVGLPVPWVLLTLPLLLVSTGAYRVWADLAAGRTPGLRQLARTDPGLALLTWGFGLVVALLLGLGDPGVVAASVTGAVGALILPLAFAYGAVRGRPGVAAVHGGLVLAALRPDLAVTLAALTVIAAFAIVASAGSLVLCVPALVAIFSCVAVADELQRIGAVAT